MRTRLVLSVIAFVGTATLAGGQSTGAKDSLRLTSPAGPAAAGAPAVPAQAILDLRDSLALSDGQLTRLRALARSQVAALTHATAAYLRAEADLLDASRTDNFVARRSALEKRAKIGIDGEMARLQADRDARAVLTVEQRTRLQTIADQTDARRSDAAAVWAPLVAPTRLAWRFDQDSVVRDSGQVRMKVTPSYAEIFIDDVNVGTNFKQVTWPVGPHVVKFLAPGCGNPVEMQITVVKGRLLILPPVTIPGC